MLLALLLIVGGQEIDSRCTLMKPVAPNEAAARRLAEAVIQNVPASARAREAAAAGEPYELIVESDPEDPDKWIAFQHPPDKQGPQGEVIVTVAGHGLEFRIDRCTGSISHMHYSR